MQSKLFCVLLVVSCASASAFGSDAQAEVADISPFDGAFADALWTIIAFVVLLIVLRKLAWKPILAALNARKEHIEKQITDANETRKEAEQVLAQHRTKLGNAESEGKGIVAGYVNKAQQEAKELVAEARDEAEALRLQAQADIERARKTAHAELLDQAGELVLRLGQEILGRTLTDEDNKNLVAEAIARLKHEEKKKD
ncbi:MAG: F0F1 ATP synthase subunit B [Planctomycetota bacterium]|jgi:F-type H+-transporting ATPase subunit b